MEFLGKYHSFNCFFDFISAFTIHQQKLILKKELPELCMEKRIVVENLK